MRRYYHCPDNHTFSLFKKFSLLGKSKEGDRLYSVNTKSSLARIEQIRLLKAYLNYGNLMKLPLRWIADRSREDGYLCYFL